MSIRRTGTDHHPRVMGSMALSLIGAGAMCTVIVAGWNRDVLIPYSAVPMDIFAGIVLAIGTRIDRMV